MRFRTIGATAVLLAVICAVSLTAAASPSSDGDSFVVDGISYGTNPDGTLSVIGFDPQTVPEDVVIPAEIDGVPVTHMDGRVFSGSGIRSISIPTTVTSLYEQTTFLECPTLERIDVDPANATYRSVDGVLFRGSTLLVIPASYPVADYTVPDGTEALGPYILSENTTVESITVPSTVTSIDPLSFIDGSALVDIAVDPDNPVYSSTDGVVFTDDGTRLFAFPGGRTGGYTVPDGVTAIGDYAFFGSSLTSVVISDGVTSVGTRVFQQCRDLESVSMGAGVADIGLAFMNGCPSATSVTVSEDNPHFRSDGYGLYSADGDLVKLVDGYEGAYVISEGTEVLRSYSISYNDGITSVTVPASVTKLEMAAVFFCPGITELVFDGTPSSFGTLSLALSDDESETVCDVYIGTETDLSPYSNTGTTFVYHYLGYVDGVHYSVADGGAVADGVLSSAEEVTVLDSVTVDGVVYDVRSVGFDVSRNDTLTHLTIPADVSVAPGGLSGFSALESIRVYGEGDLRSVDGVLFDADLTTLIQYPAGMGRNSYEVPDTVDTVQDGAFLNAGGLRYLTVPASVTCLGTEALSGLTLQTLRIPGAFLESDGSFYDTEVSEIVIVDGETCMDLSILDEFYGFGSVSFPSSLSELRGSTWMTFVIVDDGALRPLDAATAQDLAGRVFECGSGELIQAEAVATADGIRYMVTSFEDGTAAACGYEDGVRDITIAETVEILGGEYRVTSVADGAFANFPGDGTLTIPEGVILVGKEAFLHAGVSGTVRIPASLIGIGTDAFGGMMNATAFDVADRNPVYTDMEGLLCIQDSLIVQCPSGMTGILRIDHDIMSLDGFAWSKLTGVEIDGSVTIAERAFEHSDILYVTITGEVADIGAWAFQGSGIESFHASGIQRIDEGAFSNCYDLKHIYIPESVAYIAPDAFDRLSGSLTFQNIWGQKLEVSAESLGGLSFNLMNGSDDVLIGSDRYQNGMMFSDGTLLYSATGASEAEVAGKLGGTTLDIPGSFMFGGVEYSITGIGAYAFHGSDLTSLGDLGSVTSIGAHAFEGSDLEGALTIPDSVAWIGDYAFADCERITSLDLGSVTDVGAYAFASMDGIDGIPLEIPATLDNATANAFDGTCFTEYTVADGNRAFASVDGILYLRGSLYSVPYAYTFGGEGSGAITVPKDCNSVFDGALNCPFITAVYVEEGNTQFTSVDGVLYSADMTTLHYRPGGYGDDLIIPEGVLYMRGDALVEPSPSSEEPYWHVSFPRSLEEIGSGFPYLVDTGDGVVEATPELLAGNSFLVDDGMLLKIVRVTVESTPGGTVTGGGFYLPGESVTVTVTPDSGYTVSSILVNGQSQDSTEFRISPEEDVVIQVTFVSADNDDTTLLIATALIIAVLVVAAVVYLAKSRRI